MILNEPVTLDGIPLQTIKAPANADELARVLKNANEAKRTVVPFGGGTMLALGAPLERADIALSLANLNRVLDYQPANLTVQTEAGITLDALNQTLAQHGQFLPLDPPFPPRATLGGVLATNASGPLRVRYGSARDLLIGLRVALTDGNIVKGGGQVVKNVAGYDLPKLFIGSLGTLGVIVEATFKILPLPKTTATLVATFDHLRQANNVANQILRSPLLPLCVEILNRAASEQHALGDGITLLARFGGLENTVKRELSEVEKWSREQSSASLETLNDDDQLWARVRDLIYERENVVKIGILQTQIAQVMARAEELAQWHELNCLARASAVGILFITFDGEGEHVENAMTDLREFVLARSGHLVIQRAPRHLRANVNVWGPTRLDAAQPFGTSFDAMKKIKQEFDPNGILNPGRFFGGL